MSSVNRSEMIYRVQREPRQWLPFGRQLRPNSRLYLALHARFLSLFHPLPATSTAAVVPVSRNKSVQMVHSHRRWDAATHGAPRLRNSSSSAMTDGQDTPSLRQRWFANDWVALRKIEKKTVDRVCKIFPIL